MSSEERAKILHMVEEGKISAEEAMRLIRVLEEGDAETEGGFNQISGEEMIEKNLIIAAAVRNCENHLHNFLKNVDHVSNMFKIVCI